MKGRLAAVILAAGKGRRIGHPKLSLELGGVAFWRLISRRLVRAGVRDIVVVVRRSQRGTVEGDRLARAVINYNPELGMFSSVQSGLREMKGFSGYLLCPVDHPAVCVRTYRVLRKEFFKGEASVVRPVYRGKAGHPVIISSRLALHLLKAKSSSRLDRQIKSINSGVANIKVMDKYILVNINTHKELRRAREHNRHHPGSRPR
jgi:CTP:molybdopterin cytidylyltransferase MocA